MLAAVVEMQRNALETPLDRALRTSLDENAIAKASVIDMKNRRGGGMPIVWASRQVGAWCWDVVFSPTDLQDAISRHARSG